MMSWNMMKWMLRMRTIMRMVMKMMSTTMKMIEWVLTRTVRAIMMMVTVMRSTTMKMMSIFSKIFLTLTQGKFESHQQLTGQGIQSKGLRI